MEGSVLLAGLSWSEPPRGTKGKSIGLSHQGARGKEVTEGQKLSAVKRQIVELDSLPHV